MVLEIGCLSVWTDLLMTEAVNCMGWESLSEGQVKPKVPNADKAA